MSWPWSSTSKVSRIRSIFVTSAPSRRSTSKISILALADQFLAFIEEARRLRLELAADYLVMAAWLGDRKSRMSLPDANAPEGQSAEDMANALALRLRRLEALRGVAECSLARPQLDRDVFARGQPEPIAHIKHPQWSATLYDLLTAYRQQRQRQALTHLRFAKRTVLVVGLEAREALERLIGQSSGTRMQLDQYLIADVVEPRWHRRCSPQLSPRRSKWCAKALPIFTSTRHSRIVLTCASVRSQTMRWVSRAVQPAPVDMVKSGRRPQP